MSGTAVSAGPDPSPSTSPIADFEPIFVVGCPRSGTTLLTVMLDRHDQIAMTPETHFWDHAEACERRHPRADHETITDFLLKSHVHDLKLDREPLLARFRELAPTVDGFFFAALEQFAERQGKPRIGEKTCQHIYHIPRILREFPKAKFIWMIRDGRDAVQAMIRNAVFHSHRRRTCFTWLASVEAGLKYTAMYPENVTSVRFVDLLEEPEPELRRLMGFLGLDFQPQQLESSHSSAALPDKERFYKERALKPLDHKKVGEYKRETTRRERWLMNAIMGRRLRELGYGETEQHGYPLHLRLYDAAVNAPLHLLYDLRLRPLRNYLSAIYRGLRTPPFKRAQEQAASAP